MASSIGTRPACSLAAVALAVFGEAVTTVRFTDWGTHVLRGHADDSIIATPIDGTVAVE